jgi:intracellular multiplication protein IcmW
MVDLSLKGSHEYWFNYHDPAIYRVLAFMESVENWTLDNNQALEDAIQKLGTALDTISGLDLKEEEKFILIAAYIKATRNLRLLQALDNANPGAASKLLMHAENKGTTADDATSLFLRRNIVFERLRLLSRVFAPERLTMTQKVLEE